MRDEPSRRRRVTLIRVDEALASREFTMTNQSKARPAAVVARTLPDS